MVAWCCNYPSLFLHLLAKSAIWQPIRACKNCCLRRGTNQKPRWLFEFCLHFEPPIKCPENSTPSEDESNFPLCWNNDTHWSFLAQHQLSRARCTCSCLAWLSSRFISHNCWISRHNIVPRHVDRSGNPRLDAAHYTRLVSNSPKNEGDGVRQRLERVSCLPTPFWLHYSVWKYQKFCISIQPQVLVREIKASLDALANSPKRFDFSQIVSETAKRGIFKNQNIMSSRTVCSKSHPFVEFDEHKS